MKITTPDEMNGDLTLLEEAINKFEVKFKKEEKGKDYYHIVIFGQYNREIYDKIEEMYREAGWDKVKCRSFLENGERDGMSGLMLEKNIKTGLILD